MNAGSQNDKQMPNSMSERNNAIAFEKNNTKDIHQTSNSQFSDTGDLMFNQNQSGRPDAHENIEDSFEGFIAFVEGLLVDDAKEGEQPHQPAHAGSPAFIGKRLDCQPGEVRAGYENVNHSPITSMEDIFQLPSKL